MLITARSLEEVKAKTLVYGQKQEASYENEVKNIITWSLKQIVDVNSV